MKFVKIRLIVVYAVVVLVSSLGFSGVASARTPLAGSGVATGSDVSLADVGGQIDLLWQFVDDNAGLPDDQFYPKFVEHATVSLAKISSIYKSIKIDTTNTDQAAAMTAIKKDVGVIRDRLETWRKAGLDRDSYNFEVANDSLSSAVDTYNADVDAYNVAKYGSRTQRELAVYVGTPALVFAVLCATAAWAFYRNARTQEVVGEVMRRIRWYITYAVAALLGMSLIPCLMYFFTTQQISIVVWLPAAVVLAVLLRLLVWYFRVGQLPRSHRV